MFELPGLVALREAFLRTIMSDWYRQRFQRFEVIIPYFTVISIEFLVAVHFAFSYIWIESFYTRWFVMLLISGLDLIFLVAFFIAWRGDCGTVDYVLAHLSEYPNTEFMTQKFLDSLPRCKLCGVPKPPRCHHCRRCGHCHLRLDHHCPTVGQCIAIGNQQAFMMMLGWACVLIATGWPIMFFGPVLPGTRSLPMIIRCVLTSLDVCLFGGCAVFLWKILKKLRRNVTTFDIITGNVTDRYDLGPSGNFKCIFGDSFWRKVLPHRRGAITGFEYALESYRKKGCEPEKYVNYMYM